MSHMWHVPLIPGQPTNAPLWFRKSAAEKKAQRVQVLVWTSLNVTASAIITPSHATWNKYNLTHMRAHTQTHTHRHTHAPSGCKSARVWLCEKGVQVQRSGFKSVGCALHFHQFYRWFYSWSEADLASNGLIYLLKYFFKKKLQSKCRNIVCAASGVFLPHTHLSPCFLDKGDLVFCYVCFLLL